MTGRLQQIERLYHAALEHEESEWDAFLDAECAGDDALRREVGSLLEYSKRSSTFIESPALEKVAHALASEESGKLSSSDIHVDRYLPGSRPSEPLNE